ncbi:MAG: exo-alpha-sialidase [Spirochaetes bacterium]|nr:exo-alpha-sialidase [Spirochaetota bacterium]
MSGQSILASDWNPKAAADKVLAGLVKISAPVVKGAHDAEMAIVNGKAYIVYEANDKEPGESAAWHYVYAALSVVDVKTGAVEKIIPFARSGQEYENEALPPGACFVPRIIQKDTTTLRCYFASEDPGKRQAQTWHIDFDMKRVMFINRIFRTKLTTSAGTFDMQPKYFHEDAARQGFPLPAADFGFYIFDSFKRWDGKTYVVLNNYIAGQNALATLNDGMDTFTVIGHYNEPCKPKMTESAVNRLPDGTWMAICRQEGGNNNYLITTSTDGRTWSRGTHRDHVKTGSYSKPTFDCINGVYYLGWQDAAAVNGANRSVFNVDVSIDGKTWERKYRFETEKSFQYPVFREYQGNVYLAVTQGDYSDSRKERIMFGQLE